MDYFLNNTEIKIERTLLVLASLVVIFAVILAASGKLYSSPGPMSSVNVNAASYGEIAAAADLNAIDTARYVHSMANRPNQQFSSVAQFLSVSQRRGFRFHSRFFVVRTSGDFKLMVAKATILVLFGFLLYHLLLRKISQTADPFILPIVELLCGVGLATLISVKDPLRDSAIFYAQSWGIAIYGIIGASLPITRIWSRLTFRRYLYIYAIASVGLMVLLIVFGGGPGGIHIRLFGFEPIEVIKLLMVFFVASYLVERDGAFTSNINRIPKMRDVGPLVILYFGALLLFVVVRDLGPALLLYGSFLGMIYFASSRSTYPLIGALMLFAASVGAYYMHLGFFTTRVVMWLHPWANLDRHGVQLAQGLWGMATGGTFGSGLGLGKPQFMSRSESDLVFASISEQLGFVGGFTVLMCFVLIAIRGWRVTILATNNFDRYLAFGVTLLLALQAIVITAGVTGLIPLTGITLPFVSVGTSSLVVDFLSVGILLHISSKPVSASGSLALTPNQNRSLKIVMALCSLFLLVGVGLCGLLPLQVIRGDAYATMIQRSPDADGIVRGHQNPRLTSFALLVKRGRILDRNGVVLARDSTPADSNGTSLFSPDGRKRIYAAGYAFGQIIQLVEAPNSPSDSVGSNDSLRGFVGYKALLHAYRSMYGPRPEQIAGTDVTLSIDSNLQKSAQDALASTLRQESARNTTPKTKGAITLVDVASGQILCAASAPSFDASTITPSQLKAIRADQTGNSAFRNKALFGLYVPGSSFKIVTATSAYQNNLQSKVFYCAHALKDVTWKWNGRTYYRRKITDEDGFPPHGETDLTKALIVSCNVYFAQLGIALGPDRLRTTAVDSLGFQYLLPTDSIASGLPDCAYGQGTIRVTPIEMASACQMIANNGTRIRPHIIKDATALSTSVLNPSEALELQRILAGVTTVGTARGVFDSLRVSVSGKTGSAQNDQDDRQTHSWFVGYAPSTNPTVAFSCVIDNAGAGRSAAAPTVRSVLSTIF